MKFFFPDAQDFVDPGFDFAQEAYSPARVRQRDDRYAHEVFAAPPYDGMLISKAIADGRGLDSDKRYTDAQRHRLLRSGARDYFRLPAPLRIMGDCGAFSYVRDKTPPFTPDEVIDFYEATGVDLGTSVDHVILGYNSGFDRCLPGIDPAPDDWRQRQAVTIALAAEFFRRHRERNCRSRVELHLFGVTRCEMALEFAAFGVTSFDSTSPLK